MAIFRREDGFSNVESDNSGGAIPFPVDPEKWMIWVEDFTQYDITQAEGYWNLDDVIGGDDAIVGPAGILTLALGGATTDSQGLQLKNAPFQLTSGKKAIFKSRMKIVKAGGTIAQVGFVIGLTSYQLTDNFMDGPPPTTRAFDDGWCFVSYDATANVLAMQGEADVYSTEVATTIVDDTWMLLDIYWDGEKSTFYKDNVKLVEITSNPPTSVISPVVFISAGEAQADVLHCDYLMVAIER